MRCTDIEKLVSLHVRGDLDDVRESIARAHVETCADCRRLACEYLNVLQLMRLYEPPEFSDETFEAIRSDVLCEINLNNLLTKSKSSSPAPLLFGRRFLHRRTVVAASLALLIVSACAVLAAFIQFKNANIGSESDRAADISKRSGANEPTTVTTDLSKASVENPASLISDRKFASAPGGNKKIAREFLRASTRASRTNVSRPTDGDAENVSASLPSTEQTIAVQSTQGLENVARVSIASRETLRLEIQTSDPDIRIIWFAPKADAK